MARIYSKQLNVSGSDLLIGNISGGFDSAYLNPSMSIASAINIISVSASGVSYWTGSIDGYIERSSNVLITGSLYVSETGSFEYMLIDGGSY